MLKHQKPAYCSAAWWQRHIATWAMYDCAIAEARLVAVMNRKPGQRHIDPVEWCALCDARLRNIIERRVDATWPIWNFSGMRLVPGPAARP